MKAEIKKRLAALPSEQGMGQPLGALTGDIQGYVIASECRTLFVKSIRPWPWSVACKTDVERLCFTKADIIEHAHNLLDHLDAMQQYVDNHPHYQLAGFDPSRWNWQVVSVGCSTLAEPPWRVTNRTAPITLYTQPS